jgi:flagellar assembly protein FliH
MADNVIPQGALSDYQRWEPESLNALSAQLPTAESLEEIHQQAHQEGYEIGFNEGMATGYQQGKARAEQEVLRLNALIDSVEEAVSQVDQATREALLGLALEISKQILRQALKIKPELLLPIVRGAMESIPQHSQHPHLHLHPEDAMLVRAHMQAEIAHGGWKIVEDHRMEQGGCRIETTAAEVDATLPSRWQRLSVALSQDVSWLDDEHH